MDKNLYVRSYKGSKGLWYHHIQLNQNGKISAGGITKEVNFIDIGMQDKALRGKIDQEYRLKYQKFGKNYVDPMISAHAQITTTRLDPK